MESAKQHIYAVPCTLADERLIIVEARDPDEAKEKIAKGQHKRIGRSLTRGFLLIGKPREVER